jgi:hypothetical protein
MICIPLAQNFITIIAESESRPYADDAINVVNICFTVAFSVELLLNAYAHWFTDFINGWRLSH